MTDLDVDDVRQLVVAQRAEMEERQKTLDKLRDSDATTPSGPESAGLPAMQPEAATQMTADSIKADRERRLGLTSGTWQSLLALARDSI
jgi:hypothetical protein